MRFADNFNPEWGYLAPAPSFLRTTRIVLVAVAIGATAGGAVVFSLVDHPAAEETSVAARTLVEPAERTKPQTVVQEQRPSVQPQPQASAQAGRGVDSPMRPPASAHIGSAVGDPSSPLQAPPKFAGLAESPAAATPDVAPLVTLNDATAADPAVTQKKFVKKQQQQPPVARSVPATQQLSNVARAPLALLRALAAPRSD